MKKNRLTLVVPVIALLLIFLIYSYQYPIKDNYKALASAILPWISNDGSDDINNVEIKKLQNINDKTIALFTFNNEKYNIIGIAFLDKGLNNKYRIESTLSSNGKIYVKADLNSATNQYTIFAGENPDRRIAAIVLADKSDKYTYDISNDDYFIKYFKNQDKSSFDITMSLYAKDGSNITNLLGKEYPEISTLKIGFKKSMETHIVYLYYGFILIFALVIILSIRKLMK